MTRFYGKHIRQSGMEITVLGSGGNTPTPMPTCDCEICAEARTEGVPYARRGNSLFVHDENILIDVPELIWQTLDRERIESVDYVLLTHYHADHTLGMRVLQALGIEEPPLTDFIGDPPTLLMSPATYERAIEPNEVFQHLTDQWASIDLLEDGASRRIGTLDLTHVAAGMQADDEKDVSGFLLSDGEANVFISPDENRRFDLSRLPALDLWIKETGYFSETPDGRRLVTEQAERTTIEHEMRFEESLAQVREVEPERTVFTEIEELYRRSYDDYQILAQQHQELNIEFAYDGMQIAV